MKHEWKALAVAVSVSAVSLFSMSVFAHVLQDNARANSHELPASESLLLLKPAPGPEALAAGRKLFLNSCAHCHGIDASGDEGPDLHDLQMSDRHIVNVIKTGFKGEMPSFAKKHSAAEIAQILAYVRSLKNDSTSADAGPSAQ